jgi:hypothetical protein
MTEFQTTQDIGQQSPRLPAVNLDYQRTGASRADGYLLAGRS